MVSNVKNPNSKIVSVDIQDIVPIEGVNIVKGDITKQETIYKILSYFNNEKVDVVIFDGAPDVTGLIDIDMYMQVQLIIFALIICLKVLKEEGKFVAKVFRDKNISDYYYEKLKLVFSNVHYFKPASSRNTSHETFVICEDFNIDNIENDLPYIIEAKLNVKQSEDILTASIQSKFEFEANNKLLIDAIKSKMKLYKKSMTIIANINKLVSANNEANVIKKNLELGKARKPTLKRLGDIKLHKMIQHKIKLHKFK